MAKELAECLKLYSNYAYFDGLKWELDKSSNFVSPEIIERKFLFEGSIPKSDLYVAEIVGKYSFVTADMVREELEMMHADPKNDMLVLPKAKIGDVKSILERLAKNGLVRTFKYNSVNGVMIRMYCPTAVGMNMCKKILYSEVKTEDLMVSVEPAEEAFRRLVASYMGFKMRKEMNMKFKPGKRIYFPKFGREYIYGKLEYGEGEDKKVIIIEPFYFHADDKIVNPERINNHNNKRIEVLNEYISKLKSHNENLDVKVAFIFEDKKGLMAAAMASLKLDMVRSGITSDLLEAFEAGEDCVIKSNDVVGMNNVCFTSEPILCHAENEELLIGLANVTNGKPAFKQKYQL